MPFHTLRILFFLWYRRGEVQVVSVRSEDGWQSPGGCGEECWHSASVQTEKVLKRPQTCSEQWARKWDDLSHPTGGWGVNEGGVTVKMERSVIIQINVTGDICRAPRRLRMLGNLRQLSAVPPESLCPLCDIHYLDLKGVRFGGAELIYYANHQPRRCFAQSHSRTVGSAERRGRHRVVVLITAARKRCKWRVNTNLDGGFAPKQTN